MSTGTDVMSRIDRAGLDRAMALALSSEPPLPREMEAWLATTLAAEPWPHVMGEVIDRGGPNGVITVAGREVARWGDPDRREMAFSIAKSALGSVAGLAVLDGRLEDLDEPVIARLPLRALGGGDLGEGEPDDPQAAREITWRQLLTQTSDWRGTLYDVPWWADPQGRQGPDEPVHGPGNRFSYNDVRTNLCSLALTHLHGVANDVTLARIVPEGDWSWRGLRQMHTRLADGRTVPVTTGGSHWGGGLWMTAHELETFGRAHLRPGALPAAWLKQMLEPTPDRPAYGLMWWRNPEGSWYPGSDPEAFTAHGTGDQVVLCDPRRDLVAVIRWAEDPNPILAAITEAVAPC